MVGNMLMLSRLARKLYPVENVSVVNEMAVVVVAMTKRKTIALRSAMSRSSSSRHNIKTAIVGAAGFVGSGGDGGADRLQIRYSFRSCRDYTMYTDLPTRSAASRYLSAVCSTGHCR